MKERDGGPAFPTKQWNWEPGMKFEEADLVEVNGMSLRDYFASKAKESGQCPHNVYEHKKRAEWCYDEADAMLEARQKGRE